MVVGALAGLLVAAAVVGAVGSSRAHAAYRESLRELRDGDRRLEPGGTGRRLEDELRWYADVAAATRDAGWRSSALVVLALLALALVPGCWALASSPPTLTAVSVVVLLVAILLVAALAAFDGRRSEAGLRSATRRSALGKVRRLEDSLAQVQRSTQAMRAAHRSWLRTRAADYPLASMLAALRRRAYQRSVARRSRAVGALTRAVPVSLSGLSVRAPDGYAEGLQGLSALAGGAPLDDETWAAAVADLGRAAERDAPRRTRWLSALAACAELRSDPPARESAARWALDAAALPPRAPGDPRSDPLPDTVALEPVRPGTWERALHRARRHHAGPILLAEVTLRWAYALVSADEVAAGPAPTRSAPPVPSGRTSPATTEIIPTARGGGARPTTLTTDRPMPPPHGSTAAGTVPSTTDPTRPITPTTGATRPITPSTGPTRPITPTSGPTRPITPASGPTRPITPAGATAAAEGRPDHGAPHAAAPDPIPPHPATTHPAAGGTARGPSEAARHAAVLDPAVAVAAEIMAETSDPDEYLRRVRPGFESLGATSAQLSRLVPAWTAPTPAA
ncbi:MAG TPA: hypothetical protein VI357_19850 [Mycobacteriales bacterium]